MAKPDLVFLTKENQEKVRGEAVDRLTDSDLAEMFAGKSLPTRPPEMVGVHCEAVGV